MINILKEKFSRFFIDMGMVWALALKILKKKQFFLPGSTSISSDSPFFGK